MRPVLVKAYGGLSPVPPKALADVQAVLESWFIEDAAEMEGDLLRISFEGDAFPDDEVVDALKPFLCGKSWGRLDVLDLEAWTLRRWQFGEGRLRVSTATLNKALDTSLQ